MVPSVHLTVCFACFLASLTCFFASLIVVASMGPRYVYKDMLDNVVNHITCVSMNHQNQLEQMANGAMFATRDTQCPLWLRLANPYVSLTREAEHEELRSMTP
jgi:uncharacterized protein YjaG (DUF416 family)